MIVLWIYRSGALATIRLYAFVWAKRQLPPSVLRGNPNTL